MPAGRPSALTPEVAKAIIESVREGNWRSTAAAKAGVHRNSLYNWLERGEREDAVEPYASFATDLLKAEAEHEATVLGQILSAGPAIPGVQGETPIRGLTWFMERRYGQRWNGNVRANTDIAVEEIMKRIVEVLEPASLEKVRAALSTDPGSRSAAEPRH